MKSVRLIAAASTHALRIGAATGECNGVRFAVREKLDGGAVVWKFHTRSFEPPERIETTAPGRL